MTRVRRFILSTTLPCIGLCLLMALAAAPCRAQGRELTLVYKDSGKPPYMAVAPDSSGLYLDMMTRACEKVGFGLKVLRLPKKRTYSLLETGRADLYASAQFRDYRSKFLYYMPNGLFRYEEFWGLTATDIPRISSISDITQYDLLFMVERGSSWPRKAQRHGVPYEEISRLAVADAVTAIRSGRPFFYSLNREKIEAYMAEQGLASLESVGVRIHTECCEDNAAPLYTNFSRNSPHYAEEPNPNYDRQRPLSAENFPYRLVPGSVPYRLQEALREMRDSGETAALVRQYFPDKWQEILN